MSKLVVQVNGKVRDRTPRGCAEETAKDAIRRTEKIAAALDGVEVVREIYVPGRLMNFVVKSK
ncbi:MAG: hypothetical protein R2848_06580 [Thermomicrobiales bacterium]